MGYVMNNLPKLYAPVLIKFWSLRSSFGAGGGVSCDNDEIVVRKCRRVLLNNYDWKWQIIDINAMREWDWRVDIDQESLDNTGSDVSEVFIKGY